MFIFFESTYHFIRMPKFIFLKVRTLAFACTMFIFLKVRTLSFECQCLSFPWKYVPFHSNANVHIFWKYAPFHSNANVYIYSKYVPFHSECQCLYFLKVHTISFKCQCLYLLKIRAVSVECQCLYFYAQADYRNTTPASSYQQQKLRVCEVCSAYLGIHDNDRRLADHFGGKLHVGFLILREKLDELRVMNTVDLTKDFTRIFQCLVLVVSQESGFCFEAAQVTGF